MTQTNADPKVSVFMTTFQQVSYVAEALESVLAQDYPNMEIIIGDDGSSDGTQELLSKYQSKYGRKIKLLLSKANLGITVNCNKVFKECTGEYIAFQAGDDVWLPGKITTQVEHMESHPECSICYHNLEMFDDETASVLSDFNNAINPPRTGAVDVVIREGCFNGAISNMVRRSQCPPHGFDERIPIASDWLFWIETLLDGSEIHYIDQILGRYRVRQNSTSHARSERILDNFVDHLNSLNILLIKKPDHYQAIFHRMFEIYKTLSETDPKNRAIYRTLYFSRKFLFMAISLRNAMGARK